MSEYTDRGMTELCIIDPGMPYRQRPFTFAQFLRFCVVPKRLEPTADRLKGTS